MLHLVALTPQAARVSFGWQWFRNHLPIIVGFHHDIETKDWPDTIGPRGLRGGRVGGALVYPCPLAISVRKLQDHFDHD
jgi:hypothetical protein